MLYLIRKTKRSKAHMWNGRDTYCTMYSTGGMNKKKYEVVGETYKQPTCTMCMNIFNKSEGKHERHRVHTT